jgi:hypothetical protein
MAELGGVAVELPRLDTTPRGITSARDRMVASMVGPASATTRHSARRDGSTRQDREPRRDCFASERRRAGTTSAHRQARANPASTRRLRCWPWGAAMACAERLFHDQPSTAQPTTSVRDHVGQQQDHRATTSAHRAPAMHRPTNDVHLLQTASHYLFGSLPPAGRCDTIFPPRCGPRRNHAGSRQGPSKRRGAIRRHRLKTSLRSEAASDERLRDVTSRQSRCGTTPSARQDPMP